MFKFGPLAKLVQYIFLQAVSDTFSRHGILPGKARDYIYGEGAVIPQQIIFVAGNLGEHQLKPSLTKGVKQSVRHGRAF